MGSKEGADIGIFKSVARLKTLEFIFLIASPTKQVSHAFCILQLQEPWKNLRAGTSDEADDAHRKLFSGGSQRE